MKCEKCFHYEACKDMDIGGHMNEVEQADCRHYLEVMTPEAFEKRMKFITNADEDTRFDEELSHSWADDEMCRLLTSLGYSEGVKLFEDMPKYYG